MSPALAQVALAAVAAGDIASDLESERLDFKEHRGSTDDLLRRVTDAVLCFANHVGGVVVIGVKDRTAGPDALVGTTVSLDLIKRRVYQLTVPPILVSPEELTLQGRRVVLVHVPESPEVHSDTRGRAPRRVGTDCVSMSAGEQSRLRDERLGLDWSAKGTEHEPAAVDPAAMAAVRRRFSLLSDSRRALARSSDLDVLRALGVLNGDGRLNRAGVLLLTAVEDERAGITYQYRPTPAGEPRAVERLSPPLVLVFDRALELVSARRNATLLTLPDGQQIQLEDFPDLAVREAVANALMHRDYQLKQPISVEHSQPALVVDSPGPLVAGVTSDNILTHPSKPRNPALNRAFRVLGLAEVVGRGVDRMYREMIRSGRGVPLITSHSDSVRVALDGGDPNTQIARFVAGLPFDERDDIDTLLVLFALRSRRTIDAKALAPLAHKSVEEAEPVLRRLAAESVGMVEPTRQTVRRAHPNYRLRGDALQALGSAVPYRRRTIDEIDRKVIAHIRVSEKVTNKTIRNLFDVDVYRARSILADLVDRGVIVKASSQQRGPGVAYAAGPSFPR